MFSTPTPAHATQIPPPRNSSHIGEHHYLAQQSTSHPGGPHGRVPPASGSLALRVAFRLEVRNHIPSPHTRKHSYPLSLLPLAKLPSIESLLLCAPHVSTGQPLPDSPQGSGATRNLRLGPPSHPGLVASRDRMKMVWSMPLGV